MPGFHTILQAWRGCHDSAIAVPRAGLVAWHDLWFPNILPQSNTFSTSWGTSRATVIESASIYVPGTTRKAWKLVEDSTTGATHLVSLGSISMDAGTWTAAVKCKADGRHLRLRLWSSSDDQGCYFNLATGSVGDALDCTGAITDLGDGWYLCMITFSIPAFITNGGFMLHLASGASNGSEVFDGTGTEPYTEEDPGIYIADAQLYPSATLPPYAPTTTLQSDSGLLDISGHGLRLSRGSNPAAADTNDPAVLGPGLRFDGTGANDDYAATGSLASHLALAGPWTLILAAKNTYAADAGLAALSSAANVYAGINSSAANALKAVSSDAGGATASAGTITATDGSAYVLALTNDGTTLTLHRLDDMSSCSVALETMSGNALLTLGGYNGVTGAIQTATIYGDMVYSRVLATGELQRIYRALKPMWAARGVVLT